jgi:5-methylcytosine-specific restriction endonuclease McrA
MDKLCVKCGTYQRYKNGSCVFCAGEYRKANAEKRNTYQRAYAAKNPLVMKEQNKKYREENKQKIREKQKEWESNNRDHVNSKCREWRKNNPEKAFLIAKRYRQANPEAKALIAHNRRTLIKGDKPTTDIVRKLYQSQNGKCVCCGADLKKHGFHLDHIVPLSKGGRHIDSNLQLLTPTCNRSKSDKDPIDFMQSRGLLI